MSHPVYVSMSWVYVLSSAEKTLATVKALLAGAYERDAAKYTKNKARSVSL